MAHAPSHAFLVSHTHWDREWYHPYHRFRGMLVDVVREVLDRLEHDEAYRHFLLDGQAVILEDYLEIHPEDEPRLRDLVTRGALTVGPWYVLPDEFLVSGEATARNLLVGRAVASRVGRTQRVGYLPDSFGHIAQMPQILKRSGIDSFVYTRGNGEELDGLGHEFWWAGPDGTEVLAINQCEGYCNAGALGLEAGWEAKTRREVDPARAVEQVRRLFETMRRRSNGSVYLLSNGCDHDPPLPRGALGEVLQALRRAFPDTEFTHGSLEQYLDAVRGAGFVTNRYRGELLGGKHHFILSGVWSARLYLKQLNDQAQTMLERVLEPVSAYTHFMHDLEYPAGHLAYAWKRLLQNHAHDSICGCSTDRVHQDMLPRFAAAIETADQELRRQLTRLAPTHARAAEAKELPVILVANPLPISRAEVVDRVVVIDAKDAGDLGVFDEAGAPVPATVVGRHAVERFWGADIGGMLSGREQADALRDSGELLRRRSVDAGADGPRRVFVAVQFLAEELPALGHANFFVRPVRDDRRPPAGGVTVTNESLENEHYLVQCHANGSFDVTVKATGRRLDGLNLFEDTEDVGDEYNHGSARHSTTLTSAGCEGRRTIVEATGLAGQLETAFDLDLPRAVAPDRSRRSEDTVACPIATRVRLVRGSPVIAVETAIENRARDHRLRVLFPTGITTDTLISDGHFSINHRPIDQPPGTDWVEPPAGTHPQQGWSLVQDGDDGEGRGLAVLNRGLPEIQALRTPDGVTLALTLLRSVGWLSRDDFPARRYRNAGPMIPTPEAQCLGRHRAHYALVPFSGEYIERDIAGIAAGWRVPVLTIQGVTDGLAPGGRSFLSTRTRRTAVTAIKRQESRDTLVVRLYNLTGEPVDETLEVGRAIEAGWRLTLLEDRETELAGAWSDGRLQVSLGPCEIATVELALAAGSA